MQNTDLSEVYNFIVSHYREHQIPPTNKEIVAALGLSSTSVADYAVKILYDLGVLWPGGYHRKSRRVRVTGAKWGINQARTDESLRRIAEYSLKS